MFVSLQIAMCQTFTGEKKTKTKKTKCRQVKLELRKHKQCTQLENLNTSAPIRLGN